MTEGERPVSIFADRKQWFGHNAREIY